MLVEMLVEEVRTTYRPLTTGLWRTGDRGEEEEEEEEEMEKTSFLPRLTGGSKMAAGVKVDGGLSLLPRSHQSCSWIWISDTAQHAPVPAANLQRSTLTTPPFDVSIINSPDSHENKEEVF
ncbi:unnamed protein product [Pleuronectes platessa]|uniref:Uncharacterized protein n=1 Tax=Pleuronectes platessa TaxID=8262 RepID=A0A9N7U1B0_PLEPL|nr:unnamed protein product [Pleuronectes platessa]